MQRLYMKIRDMGACRANIGPKLKSYAPDCFAAFILQICINIYSIGGYNMSQKKVPMRRVQKRAAQRL
jgi:hypothetical protein